MKLVWYQGLHPRLLHQIERGQFQRLGLERSDVGMPHFDVGIVFSAGRHPRRINGAAERDHAVNHFAKHASDDRLGPVG